MFFMCVVDVAKWADFDSDPEPDKEPSERVTPIERPLKVSLKFNIYDFLSYHL